jgi:hypothetical protein
MTPLLLSDLVGFRKSGGGEDRTSDAGHRPSFAPGRSMRASNQMQHRSFRLFGGGDRSGGAVTSDMVAYYKELSISKDLVDRLKHASIRNPQLLLGWQVVVVLEAGAEAGKRQKNTAISVPT